MSKQTGPIPKKPALMPKNSASIPKKSASIPKKSASIPKKSRLMSKKSGLIRNLSQTENLTPFNIFVTSENTKSYQHFESPATPFKGPPDTR